MSLVTVPKKLQWIGTWGGRCINWQYFRPLSACPCLIASMTWWDDPEMSPDPPDSCCNTQTSWWLQISPAGGGIELKHKNTSSCGQCYNVTGYFCSAAYNCQIAPVHRNSPQFTAILRKLSLNCRNILWRNWFCRLNPHAPLFWLKTILDQNRGQTFHCPPPPPPQNSIFWFLPGRCFRSLLTYLGLIYPNPKSNIYFNESKPWCTCTVNSFNLH